MSSAPLPRPQVYDPNFQQQSIKSEAKGGKKASGGAGQSVEGKLEKIRVKKLKFTLKASNYEDAQEVLSSSELSDSCLLNRFVLEIDDLMLEHSVLFDIGYADDGRGARGFSLKK